MKTQREIYEEINRESKKKEINDPKVTHELNAEFYRLFEQQDIEICELLILSAALAEKVPDLLLQNKIATIRTMATMIWDLNKNLRESEKNYRDQFETKKQS